MLAGALRATAFRSLGTLLRGLAVLSLFRSITATPTTATLVAPTAPTTAVAAAVATAAVMSGNSAAAAAAAAAAAGGGGRTSTTATPGTGTATAAAASPFSTGAVAASPLRGGLPLDINMWSASHVLTYVGDHLRLPRVRDRMQRTIHVNSFDEVDGALLLREGLARVVSRFGLAATDRAFAPAAYRWAADRARSREWTVDTLLDNPDVRELAQLRGPAAAAETAEAGDASSLSSSSGGDVDAGDFFFELDRAALRDGVVGSCTALFAGDSLALPAHWYYDPRLMAREVPRITGYRAVPEHHGGNSIMSRHWREDKHGIQELAHLVVSAAGRENWERPYRHYHAGLPAGSNTVNVQLTQMLARYLSEGIVSPNGTVATAAATAAAHDHDGDGDAITATNAAAAPADPSATATLPSGGGGDGAVATAAHVPASAAGYEANEYLQRYVAFLKDPAAHGDTYLDGFHRQFLVRHMRDPARPLTECAGVEHHDTASSGGVVQVPVLLLSSLVPRLQSNSADASAARATATTSAATASDGGCAGNKEPFDSSSSPSPPPPLLRVSAADLAAATEEASAVIRAHVELTHDSEQLHRHVRLYSDLVAVTLVTSAAAEAARGGRAARGGTAAAVRALRSNLQRAGRHLGWDFEGMVATGVSDLQIAYGGIMGPACYIGDSLPLALFLAYKYADDTGAALLANANLGGEACYRGAVLGGLLGALSGASGIRPTALVTDLPPALGVDVQTFADAVMHGTVRVFPPAARADGTPTP